MPWYFCLAHFFAGAFLVNAIPHFVNGVSGRPFPTPFASPPGRGLSSPVVNVVWAAFNFVVGTLLLRFVGIFDRHNVADVLAVGAGALMMAILSAKIFGDRLA
jgi:hypothetical protein